jgi:hypothetical protein
LFRSAFELPYFWRLRQPQGLFAADDPTNDTRENFDFSMSRLIIALKRKKDSINVANQPFHA